MNKLLQIIKKSLNWLLGLFGGVPKIWLFYNLGSTIPTPPSRPQDKPLFDPEKSESDVINTREGRTCYRYYAEFLIFLASEVIDNKLPIGTTFYIPREIYVNHHLERRPGTNPKSYHNGPIARELHRHQYFVRKGIEFEQRLVENRDTESGYKIGEVLFELKRIK